MGVDGGVGWLGAAGKTSPTVGRDNGLPGKAIECGVVAC